MASWIPRKLRQLLDVDLDSIADGEVPVWDDFTETFIPGTATGGTGAPDTADYLVGTAQGGLSAEIVVGATPGGELGGTWAAPTVDATHSGSTHAAVQAAAEATAAAALSAHLTDTVDAHDASAVSVNSATLVGTGTDVQAVLEELDDAIAAAGAPATADYLVGTAQGGLSAEIVVGTSPGGELGGTWASPTVDATHSGSSHASVQSAAEATAAAALASHEADTTSIHGIANTANLYAAGGTDVAVADGGTGSSTASGARTNLGLVIGTDVQAQDATLAALAAANWAANSVPVGTGADTLSQLSMGASTILARLASGNTVAATPAEIVALLQTLLPAYLYDRTTYTTNLTSTATTEAGATTVMTSGAITPGAGVAVRVGVRAAGFKTNAGSSASVLINVWRSINGGTAVDLGRIAQMNLQDLIVPLHQDFVDTPGAGSIVYTIRMWGSAAGTCTIFCTAPYLPAALAIYKL